ncbi:hypothetical protein DESHY_110434 [Desulforamulus hydrothermalis Lam5 = DSM 18033]|uniref:Uncharacterized protein n=1 Tax=Desulforamulus hydrothermalis Lam5 = DSM 18033 TaxID=1121428 RepID=K8DXY7_9FIRM|nr:hypothetical protein DESHY_110434 [Desulforamulus hydrothermalis Lam5 = DSM 18033]
MTIIIIKKVKKIKFILAHLNKPCYNNKRRDEVANLKRGGIAQLGERLNGIQEVSGSIPLVSTTQKAPVIGAFCCYTTSFFVALLLLSVSLLSGIITSQKLIIKLGNPALCVAC